MGTEKYTQFKNKYYKGQNPVAVYNRNKNNYKSMQSKKYKSIQAEKNTQNAKSMSEYNRRKRLETEATFMSKEITETIKNKFQKGVQPMSSFFILHFC
ncbi:hypothetical protein LDL59_03030 [Kaistella anthropi]|nr:hypothetical protein [Kaistella anthropi]